MWHIGWTPPPPLRVSHVIWMAPYVISFRQVPFALALEIWNKRILSHWWLKNILRNSLVKLKRGLISYYETSPCEKRTSSLYFMWGNFAFKNISFLHVGLATLLLLFHLFCHRKECEMWSFKNFSILYTKTFIFLASIMFYINNQNRIEKTLGHKNWLWLGKKIAELMKWRIQFKNNSYN